MNVEISDENDLNHELDMDFADVLLEYLNQMNVDLVFGVPGGSIEPLFNALARSERKGGPRVVIARHECGAAFMAEGYCREKRTIGVVCSTTGPGATNLVTGVATAAVDGFPLLVITAQTALPKFGKRPLQDSSETAIDTVGMFRHCTKYNAMVSHPDQFEGKLVGALMAAVQAPKGPVHLSIPSDVLRHSYGDTKPHVSINYLTQNRAMEDKGAVLDLVNELANVSRVGVYLGNGCQRAYKEIEKLVELLNAPFASGPMGKSWVNERHPLYCGVLGYAGHESAKEVFSSDELELVLVFGANLSEMGMGAEMVESLGSRMIHIDSSVESFSRSPLARLHVCGHLDAICCRLIDNMKEAMRWRRTWEGMDVKAEKNVLGGYAKLRDGEQCLSNDMPIKPQRLMGYLSLNLPKDTRIFVDTGNAWAWSTHYLITNSNEGLFRMAMGFGSMAWAIGAVIGSALAARGKPHICLTGDGAYQMSAQEITVAVAHKAPILFIVLNDAAYGMIRFGQELSNAESIGWQLPKVDFAMMAKAVGARGILIERPEQLDELDLNMIFTSDKPTLLDVRIDSNAVPPMAQRVKSLLDGTEGMAEPAGYK